MSSIPGAKGLLSPYRILDLTTERGFICGKLFGDMGADVIKIEKPAGDPARSFGPFYLDTPDPEKSLYWWAFNLNKRGITLDIETADGKDLFKKLVKGADAVIESFDPGYMDKIGLGYSILSQVNPQIVMTSITGFGQNGPYRNFKAPDIVVWALSGNAYVTGDPDRAPLSPSFPISYIISGALQAAIGTMIAIYDRSFIGQGQYVDASAQLSLVWFVAPEPHALWEQDKTIVSRQGRLWKRPQTTPEGKTTFASAPLVYQCKDGDINFAAFAGPGMGESTAALSRWIESEGGASETLKGINWITFEWHTVSQEVLDTVAQDFSHFFLNRSKSELFDEAVKRGIMLYPVFTPKDMLEFRQLAARKYWIDIEHPELGTTITYTNPFVNVPQAPPSVQRRAPLIGEHNEDIYVKELGLSKQDLLTLKQIKVI
jgi:crotonobetainyl-CoA:carnitine CoA-transferase CaiB-like acyl-CoA transferase